jgi:hypothetical protein
MIGPVGIGLELPYDARKDFAEVDLAVRRRRRWPYVTVLSHTF